MEPLEAFDDVADNADDMPHNDWIFPDPAAFSTAMAPMPLPYILDYKS
jgi:hypothetical protein